MARPDPLVGMSVRQAAILDSFDYHRPWPEQADRIGRVRAAFKRCALAVLACTPEGPDQTAALRQLHESMMTSNKAIACEPGTPHDDPLAGPSSSGTPGAPVGGEVPPRRSGCGLRGCECSGVAQDDPNPGC